MNYPQPTLPIHAIREACAKTPSISLDSWRILKRLAKASEAPSASRHSLSDGATHANAGSYRSFTLIQPQFLRTLPLTLISPTHSSAKETTVEPQESTKKSGMSGLLPSLENFAKVRMISRRLKPLVLKKILCIV